MGDTQGGKEKPHFHSPPVTVLPWEMVSKKKSSLLQLSKGLLSQQSRNIHQCSYVKWHLVSCVMTHLTWVEWMFPKLSVIRTAAAGLKEHHS